MMCIQKFSLVLIAVFSLAEIPAGHAAEQANDPDEQFLKESKIATDAPGLLNHLQQRSGHDEDLLNLDRLIRQLAADDFGRRNQASRELVALGPPAHAALLQAQKDKDQERARRARECAEQINRAWKPGLNLTVVRRLLKLHPPEAEKALLQFLPYAADEECEEEIWFGLDRLVGQAFQPDTKDSQAGKPDPQRALAEFLTDKFPIRRAAAGYLLARRGNAEQRAAAKKLLADPDPLVRLRTAQGVLGAKDKDAIPVLIDLLEKLRWTEEAWQAEEMLHWIASDEAPETTIGAGSAEQRQKCRKAWHDWWQRNSEKIDFSKIEQDFRLPILMLARTWKDSLQLPSDAFQLVGCNGKPRWQLTRFPHVRHIQILPADQIAIIEWHLPKGTDVLSAGPPSTASEGDLEGNILSQQKVDLPGSPLFFRHLPNGDIFVANGQSGAELGPQGNVVVRRQFRAGDLQFLEPQLLNNGHVLCVRGDGFELQSWGEFDLSTGATLKQVKPQIRVAATSRIVPIPGGSFLITELNREKPARVIEVDGDGKIVWQYEAKGGARTCRLINGNTLIYSSHSRLAEIDKAGKVVATRFFRAFPIFPPCLRLVRLGFDNPANQNFSLLSFLLKNLTSKEPFIRQMATGELGELGSDAQPAIPALIDALDDTDPQVRRTALGTLTNFGPTIVSCLTKACKDKRANVRTSTAWIFGQFPEEAKITVPLLIADLKDDSVLVRRKAAWALGRLGPQAKVAVPALIEALKDKDKVNDNSDVSVSNAAVFALGRIGPEAEAALPFLIDSVTSKDPILRPFAIQALATIGRSNKSVIRVLISLLQDKEDLATRSNAASALGLIGPVANDAVPSLVKLLKVEDAKNRPLAAATRRSAAIALGKIGSNAKAAIPALIKALSDEDPDVAKEVKQSLEKIQQ